MYHSSKTVSYDSKNTKKYIQHDENVTVTVWRIIKHTKNTLNYAEHDENVTSQLNEHLFVQRLVTLKGNWIRLHNGAR